MDYKKINEALSYDHLTGLLVRKTGRNKGKVAGYNDKNGYIELHLFRKRVKAHRVAWLLFYGSWPKFQIDHINGITHDNRIINLRDVPHSINQQNRRNPQKNNKIKCLGVYKSRDRFIATIQIRNKKIYLGSFESIEEAQLSYIKTKRKLHHGCMI